MCEELRQLLLLLADRAVHRLHPLALGPSLFCWESQTTTAAASPTGQRSNYHAALGSRVLLFVREQRKQAGSVGEQLWANARTNGMIADGSSVPRTAGSGLILQTDPRRRDHVNPRF